IQVLQLAGFARREDRLMRRLHPWRNFVQVRLREAVLTEEALGGEVRIQLEGRAHGPNKKGARPAVQRRPRARSLLTPYWIVTSMLLDAIGWIALPAVSTSVAVS